MTKKSITITALICLGAIPFLILTFKVLFHAFQLDDGSQSSASVPLLCSYGILIATFVAGSQWGSIIGADTSVNFGEQKNKIFDLLILLSSNVITVILWFAWVQQFYVTIVLLLVLVFPLLLWIDIHQHHLKRINAFYFKLRVAITSLVELSLLSTLVGLIFL